MRSLHPNTQRLPTAHFHAPSLSLARWPNIPEAGISTLEAAAAVGCDPFKSPVRLWMEKTGRQDLLQPQPTLQVKADSAAYWHRLLEPIVAAHYTLRRGHQVRRMRGLLRHPEHAWMFAYLGREVVGHPDVQLLECRCVGLAEADHWEQGLPGYVRIQMLHQLGAMGAQAVDVAALIGGEDLRIHRVERDEAEITRLIEAEREFWRCVEFDQAPTAKQQAL